MGLKDDLAQLRTAPGRDIMETWISTLDEEDREAVIQQLRGPKASVDLHAIMTSYGLTAKLTAFKDYRRRVLND